MDDPRPLGLLPTLDLPPEQPVDERAASVTRGGMHDDAGGLVDDQKMLVLVGDAKRHLLRLELGRTARWYVDFQLLTACQPMAFRAPSAVDENAALAEEPLGHGPRTDLLEAGEEAIE